MVRTAFPVLVAVALTVGCRVTDHSERGVSTDILDVSASGYDPKDPASMAVIHFDSTTLNMGRVAQGVQVEKVFRFTNTGKRNLFITDVRGTCGCTVGQDWPKSPVKPGEGGTITVRFDSEGRGGSQYKTVTVVANTEPPTTVLALTGNVMAPPGSYIKE